MNKARPAPPKSERSIKLSSDIAGEPFEPGEIVAGKYRVEQVIGTGGMGVVLAAVHIELEERVALKLLRVEFHGDKEVVGRFAREAKAAVRIKSEYSAAVYDVGVDPVRGPFMVMEYLDGQDLAETVTKNGPLPVRRAVEYVMQACEALSVAHAIGITHRDVKPENLFVTKRGDGREVVKVLDFGISKFALTGSTFGTHSPVTTQGLMGSPVYMSPEQIRSTADVDHRADIWSLGAVLYEILTGRCAFDGESITEVCAKVLEAAPEAIAQHRPDVTPALAAVIERCLQKNVKDRFQNTAELAIALLPFAPSRARACAQRSMSILTAAGVSVSGLDLSSHSSMPPSSAQLAPLLIPAGDKLPRDLAAAAGLSASARPEASPKPPPEMLAASDGAPAEEPEPKKLGVFIGAGVAVILLCLLGAFVFLRQRPPSVPEEPRSRTALLESEPSGAAVFNGGLAIGTTPLETHLDVGLRALKFSKAGFENETINVTVSPRDSEPVRQRVELRAVGSAAPVSPQLAPQARPLPEKPHLPAFAAPPPPVAGKKPAPPTSVSAPPPSAPVQPSSTPPPPPRAKLVDDKPRVPIVN